MTVQNRSRPGLFSQMWSALPSRQQVWNALPSRQQVLNSLPTPPAARDVLSFVQRASGAQGEVRRVRDGFQDGSRSLRQNGPRQLRTDWQRMVREARTGSTSRVTPQTLTGMGARAARTGVLAARDLPQRLRDARGDFNTALQSGARADIDRAVGSSSRAANDALTISNNVLQLGRDGARVAVPFFAARQAFLRAAPEARPLANQVARRVAADLYQSGAVTPSQARANANRIALQSPGRATDALRASSEAQRAGRAAAFRLLNNPVARQLSRNIPLLNVGTAVLDVSQAYSDVRNPQLSTTRKVLSVATAIGSVAGASGHRYAAPAGQLLTLTTTGISLFVPQ
jgi:hypothetical protein